MKLNHKLVIILVSVSLLSACSSTSQKNAACDFIIGADNNIDIKDGRDRNGDSRKTQKKNVHLDFAIGIASAIGNAIKRVVTSEDASTNKCDKGYTKSK